MKRKLTASVLVLCLLFLGACSGRTADSSDGAQTVIAGTDLEEPVREEPAESENRLSDIDLSEGMPACAFPDLAHPSSEYSPETALALLGLCSGHTAERTAQLFEDAGVSVLLQENFEKAPGSPDYTCAYTVGVRVSPEGREQYVIAVRGTNGGEWYSNFDLVPSQDGDAAFAENFLFTAENVFAALTNIIDFSRLPQIIVCGHSRGAGCANLLGVLLDGSYIPENIYVYTFATPMTVRPAQFGLSCGNIFNVINPGDVVTRMPFAGWGFARAGTDILLAGDPGAVGRAERIENEIFGIAPDIPSYYNVRHSLTEAGESEDGLTAFELMEFLSSAFSNVSDLNNAGKRKTEIRADGGDLSGIISDESDFAPLRDLMIRAAADGGSAALEVLTEHLPATYAKLLG